MTESEDNAALLEDLEKKRRTLAFFDRILTPYWWGRILVCVLFMGVLWQLLEFAGLILGLIALFAFFHQKKRWFAEVRKTYIPIFVKETGADGYGPLEDVEQYIANASLIVPYNEDSGGETFRITRDGIKISLAYQHLREGWAEEKDGRKRKRRHFSGLMILVKLPQKKFGGTTVLTNDLPYYRKQQAAEKEGMEEISFRPPKKSGTRYSVFSGAPDEARFITDHETLEKFDAVRNAFGKGSITAAFWDRYILVTVPGRHFFVTGLYTPVADKRLIARCRAELKELLSLASWLELYSSPEAEDRTAEEGT